jgi:hypothetical protein|tara:strand:+ start:808 stop:1002 length:195 start_codon:yes stop_codon:yes gene_type:complete
MTDTVDSGQDLVFEYDETQSYDWNFAKWLRWTNREHRQYKEPEYTEEQGQPIFEKLFINLNVDK